MKQRKVVSLIGALVVIISAVALIIGCDNLNNNKDKKGNTTTTQGSAVYVANNVHDGSPAKYTITFNTDGTFMQRTAHKSLDTVTGQGTYTGDASKDGTIILTIKKSYNGTALVDYTGADATKSITISGGKFTLLGEKYTRQ